MEKSYTKIYTTGATVPLKIRPGHFATNHAHINYYIDVTTLKARTVARTVPLSQLSRSRHLYPENLYRRTVQTVRQLTILLFRQILEIPSWLLKRQIPSYWKTRIPIRI